MRLTPLNGSAVTIRAVLAAYRWPDEVLARLLALNAERAEQERLPGSTKATAKKTVAKEASRQKPVDDTQTEMF